MDVGFIGLGAMGGPMAHNLHDAGHLAAVYNRTRSKTDPFVERGIPATASPADLAEQVDVVVVMVTADDALDAVLLGDADNGAGVVDGLRPGSIVVNMSTVSVDATASAASAVGAAGGQFVDAPVSGTVGPAEEGTLTVLAGGESGVLDDIEAVLSVIGDPIVRCGGIGDGTKTKLFTNLLLGSLMQGYAEALVFGDKLGLSFEHMQSIIESSPAHAPLFDYKGAMMADRNFAKQFPIDLLRKDLTLVEEEAQNEGVYLPQTAATREAVNGASAQGHGDDDMMAIIKLLESIARTTVNPDAG